MIRGVIKKIGEIFLRDKGKKYVIVEGDKNLINPDYEISVDDLGGNNGGGSTEDDYSTDYPDDFYAQYIDASDTTTVQLKEVVGKVESTLSTHIGFPKHTIYLFIPKLIDESVQLIYDLPEATYNNSPFDPTKYYMNPTGWLPAGIEPRIIALSVGKINNKPIQLTGVFSSEQYIPLTIKFKTTDNKSYKFITRVLYPHGSVTNISVPKNADYIHCEVKYLDLESEG